MLGDISAVYSHYYLSILKYLLSFVFPLEVCWEVWSSNPDEATYFSLIFKILSLKRILFKNLAPEYNIFNTTICDRVYLFPFTP